MFSLPFPKSLIQVLKSENKTYLWKISLSEKRCTSQAFKEKVQRLQKVLYDSRKKETISQIFECLKRYFLSSCELQTSSARITLFLRLTRFSECKRLVAAFKQWQRIPSTKKHSSFHHQVILKIKNQTLNSYNNRYLDGPCGFDYRVF